MGEIFAGRYELVDLLGTGGMGDVWRIWDHREGGYRAGKVLRQSDSTSLLRFMREARWRFEHPHVLAPSGWAGEDDRIIFAMPLVHGGSASGLLRDYGPLPQAWVLPAIGQLLEALHVIHSAGLVHRDVKPANILLRPGVVPDIVLSDFGTAAPIAEPRLTRVTQVIGTPGYMSPEARYGADPEPAQDLYAVGILLIELLTGARPGQDEPARVPARFAGTPLGSFMARLLADVPRRTASAAQAWQGLTAVVPAPAVGEPVEVFDQIGPLPAGWGPDGPLPAGSAGAEERHAPVWVAGGVETGVDPRSGLARTNPSPGPWPPDPEWEIGAMPPPGHASPGPFEPDAGERGATLPGGPVPFMPHAPAAPIHDGPVAPGHGVPGATAQAVPAAPVRTAQGPGRKRGRVASLVVIGGGALCILVAIVLVL